MRGGTVLFCVHPYPHRIAMRRPPSLAMFSYRLTPQAAILFASPLFLSPIQSSCSRRRRRLASNGRVCWPEVKQARRERGGRRKEGGKEGGNKKRDMFRMQWRTTWTRSLGQTEGGGEGSDERRDATSRRRGNWQDETSSSLERAVYLLLVRPTESLKLLSCTGMSGAADQPETN